MSFFVDVVTEDSFYENLTLGVVKLLENVPYVKNVRVDRRNGCEETAIANWEQRHCCALPEDLRNFYLSTDGFQLVWNLEIAGEEFSVGRMEIGGFSSLKRYSVAKESQQANCAKQESSDQGSEGGTDREGAISLAAGNPRGCKMFEIGQCHPDSGKAGVYLVYRMKPDQEAPSIWLHRVETDRWHHLADTFTVYFRMMLVHLGLPLWQYCVTGLALPTWVEQVYFLVGPHLLPSTVDPIETISISMWNNGPTNVIDPAIFKGKEGKQKPPRKK
ncbi:tubulin polyglutamylase complex subunit 2 [Nomia melanderi]|uniref:tubulin polyglutamylase complex subunit 2 n=1 Tax=Nomia melanderi TaxID=2448451 RepID=UPI0013045EA8|nr:tubulin polyglutamylase complex subunit 2 [Nomia melanderi]XP_031848337.1 tubulin polyglutamylase complex subunit 2 [Nomia melanderi]